MILKEGSTKVVDLRTPGAEVFMLGQKYTSHYSKYALSSTQYTAYRLLLYLGIKNCFQMLLLVFIYSMMGLLTIKQEPS